MSGTTSGVRSEQANPEELRKALRNVPAQLKQFNQWVNWTSIWSEDKEKFNKPPMKASGRNGSSTDESAWTTLDKSLAALGREGVYVDSSGKRHRVTLDGVGLAGLERTPYTGIDLDHCIDPETGEINPTARKIVEDFGSYTEITPSGDGLRIWIEADKPPTWSANKGGETEIEVYDKGRFFTVTGRHLEGTPRTIEARQETLNAFMVTHAPAEKSKPKREPYTGSGDYVLDLDGFLEEFAVQVLKQARDATSERAYYIVCPWMHEHTGGDTSGTRVGQFSSGALWFKCEHGHCDGRRWEHFREELDPKAYRKAKITIEGCKLSDEEEQAHRKEQAKEAWKDCADLAQEPAILDRFVREQHESGVVGEEGIMKLLYLSITSRLLSRPVSVVVKGPSSGGKSYTTEQTLKAFPKDAYHDFSGMSERALIYTDKDFRHKFIYIPEAAGVNNEFLDYALRTLLSEHRLKYITVEQQSGKNVPREIIKEGPTGLLMTTTRAKLHPENETRLLSLTVNDTRAQTTAVMKSIAQRDNRPAKDYSQWHALQVWIEGQDNRVVVPYGELLAEKIPPIDMRIRRDFELLLNAIHAHAIIHQASRERDEAGRIMATVKDYEAVRELINDVLSAGVQARVGADLRRVVEAVDEMLGDKVKPSVRKLEQKLNMSKSVVQRHLKVALSEGYLVAAKEDNAGRIKEYGMGADIPSDVDLLPSVEIVKKATVPLSPVSQRGAQQGGKNGAQLSQDDLGQCGTVHKKHAGEGAQFPLNRPTHKRNGSETPETLDPPGTVGTVGQWDSEAIENQPGTASGTVGGTVGVDPDDDWGDV